LSLLTDTQRGSTRIEVGEEGEGTPVTTVMSTSSLLVKKPQT
jgi:hypothetical protein